MARNIYVPPSNPYALDTGYTGPLSSVNLYPDGGFGFKCDKNDMPYVGLTVTINGVDYPLDSDNNMIRQPSPVSALGYCNVALRNTTSKDDTNVVLGQPFLRSVYL